MIYGSRIKATYEYTQIIYCLTRPTAAINAIVLTYSDLCNLWKQMYYNIIHLSLINIIPCNQFSWDTFRAKIRSIHVIYNLQFRVAINKKCLNDSSFLCVVILGLSLWWPITILLKFVPKDPINDIPVLVQLMAWCRLGDKPLPEPMMASLLTHISVIRSQWVKRVNVQSDHLHVIHLQMRRPASSWRYNVLRCTSVAGSQSASELTTSVPWQLLVHLYDCCWVAARTALTHLGRRTHICVSKMALIGSDNGLPPGRRQAIIWTNAGIYSIHTVGTNSSEIASSYIFVQENAPENIICEMGDIVSRPHCVNAHNYVCIESGSSMLWWILKSKNHRENWGFVWQH